MCNLLCILSYILFLLFFYFVLLMFCLLIYVGHNKHKTGFWLLKIFSDFLREIVKSSIDFYASDKIPEMSIKHGIKNLNVKVQWAQFLFCLVYVFTHCNYTYWHYKSSSRLTYVYTCTHTAIVNHLLDWHRCVYTCTYTAIINHLLGWHVYTCIYCHIVLH